ncbi:MAG: hypothetical protein AB7F59_05210 [Bdellovibrionales bacterium]
MFNAFKYSKQLEEAGFSREQAEIQLQVITEIVEGELATKQDLKILETGLKQELESFRKDITTSFEIKISSVENKIQQVEYRMIIKLGSLLIVGFTTIATLMKIWIAH